MGLRRFSAVLALAAVMSAACGGGDGGDDKDTGASGSGENKKLTVWIMEGTNPDASGFFKDVSTAFTEKTGAALDVQFVPWASAHDKFVTSIAGGTTPDVAEVGTTWAGEFAEAGALVKLDDFVKKSDVADDLNDGLVEAGTIDGSLYGMPWYAGVRSVVYRTDLFKAAGVKPPTTWAEWVQVGKALKAANPKVIPMPVAGDNEYGLYPFIWGNGGDIAKEENGKWVSQIDSPAAREGIAFYTGLATEHGLSTPAATTWKETDLRDAFASGKAAMILSGSWTPKAILEAAPQLKGKIGAFAIPGPDGGLSPSFTGGSLLSVFNKTKNEQLALEFVNLMSTGKFATQWAEATSFFPGVDSLLAEAQASKDPLVQPFARQMVEAGKSVPVTPAYGKVQARKTVQAMLQSILSGAKDVDKATADAAAEMNKTLGSGS